MTLIFLVTTIIFGFLGFSNLPAFECADAIARLFTFVFIILTAISLVNDGFSQNPKR